MSEPSTCLKPRLSDNSQRTGGGWPTAKRSFPITEEGGAGSWKVSGEQQ